MSIYSKEHDDRLEQGDICYNLPMLIPSYLISSKRNISTWNDYIENLGEEKKEIVKLSYYPMPTWGIILSQTCDLDRDDNLSIIFAEIRKNTEINSFESKSKNKQKSHIKAIQELLRYKQPSMLYLPELIIESETYGPFEVDFNSIFLVQAKLITRNLDLFWKARIINPTQDLLKERIQHFFTRLAFEECLYFSDSEKEIYLDMNKKYVSREEVDKIRTDNLNQSKS